MIPHASDGLVSRGSNQYAEQESCDAMCELSEKSESSAPKFSLGRIMFAAAVLADLRSMVTIRLSPPLGTKCGAACQLAVASCLKKTEPH